MLRCWNGSAGGLQDSRCSVRRCFYPSLDPTRSETAESLHKHECCHTFSPVQDGGSASSPHCSHRAFWGGLAAVLLVAVLVLSVTGQIRFRAAHQQFDLQVIRITAPDRAGNVIDQSATVDQRNDVVTYSVTSHTNHTSTVLFDIKHGVICYKPDGQNTCFLRKMEQDDYDNMHSLLNESQRKVSHFRLVGNETLRHTELLEVLGGHHVDASTLREPLQSLCLHSSIYWVRKADGPAKQRLIYFCIDICFPSNVCVSVCFYYLPE
ncbi:BRICHOS domain-containing protein 5 [Scleropages formosus]|uniref:BRICHOS domain-containing protein 5 n=1 Tax=Scleropages formosus TaxID=113540 RepID=UPI0010FA651D|nr:BRICHOS domain-containing protein 5 [Scleropages formosus]